MLSFSEYKTKKQLAEMVLRYNLDLSQIAEAVAYSPNHRVTEEILNEFLGKAMQALGGAFRGAFQGARDSWQGQDAAKKQAEKAVQDFYDSLLKMGIDKTIAQKNIKNMQDWLEKQQMRLNPPPQQGAPQQGAPQQGAQTPGYTVKPSGSPMEPTAQVAGPTDANIVQKLKRGKGQIKAKIPTGSDSLLGGGQNFL